MRIATAVCPTCKGEFTFERKAGTARRFCSERCRDLATRSSRQARYQATHVVELRARWTSDHTYAVRRAHYRQLRLDVIRGYGGACACCGETTAEFLALDHVDGGGHRERRVGNNPSRLYRRLIREGFPATFRLLCHNCNQAIGVYGRCPHEAQSQLAVV